MLSLFMATKYRCSSSHTTELFCLAALPRGSVLTLAAGTLSGTLRNLPLDDYTPLLYDLTPYEWMP
jgi:hypothetical protein